MYICVFGNPADGFTIYGPFETHDEAVAYGEQEGDMDWWIMEVHPPNA